MSSTTFVDGVTLSAASWFNDADSAAYSALSSVSGTNTITATGPLNYSLGAGKHILYGIAANTNTGATTLNVSGLGAKNVFYNNVACAGGEIRANSFFIVYYDGTQYQLISTSIKKATRTVLTSGSAATYTTPTGATQINVRMVGGGGGGGAQSANAGTAGNNTTFGASLTASGGAAGGTASAAGGAGGAAANGDINIPGGAGTAGVNSTTVGAYTGPGGSGGNSYFGGAGQGGVNGVVGTAAATNSGGGGGGAGPSNGTASGSGGGAGGYVEKLITAPSATYTYTVGGTAAGGTAGGVAGGAGAAGIIIVDEYYS